MSTVGRLREAAALLRERVVAAGRSYGRRECIDLALADWLDHAADECDAGWYTSVSPATRVADAILGGDR